MSQQAEGRFLTKVNEVVRKKGLHCEKTHNIYRRGTPDCYYSAKPFDLWCEYKYSPRLGMVNLSSSSSPRLSELQSRWLLARHEEGRNVAVCLGFPQGGLFLSVEDFARSIPLAELEAKIESRIALANRLVRWLTGEHDDLFRNAVQDH